MRNHLYVDGTDLATFGVYCSGQGTFGAPEKEVTTYDVPGRNGSVLGVNTRLENIRVTYPCFIYANFKENMQRLRSFLLSRAGYVRISDSYDTTHFRLGYFPGPISPDVTVRNNAAQFNLVFDCLPQRWLTSGETVIEKTTLPTTDITNPTLFAASPLFEVFGYGEFLITPTGLAGVAVSISSDLSTDYPSITSIFLDCESNDIYTPTNPTAGIAKYVTTQEYPNGSYGVDLPKFSPGINSVRIFNSTLTKLNITPRWWEV